MKHRLALAFITITLLAGCGQKAPLYLPEEKAEPVEQKES